MAESHFVSALRQRRADCLGELEEIRAKLAEMDARESSLVGKLGHLDALIQDEAPELLLEAVKPRRPRGPHPRSGSAGPDGKRHALSQAILRTLRTRKDAMSAREVKEAVQPDFADQDDTKLLRNVSVFLSNKKKAGLLHASTGNDDGPVRYRVAA